MRILIVEDEKKLINFLKTCLEEENYKVDTATDGGTGFKLASTNNYDIIILDLMLPEKDGFTILKELRDEKIVTPVIILTSRGGVDDRIYGLDIGADDYLPKPFSIEELTSRINSVLRRSKSEGTVINCGDLILNTVTHCAYRGGKEITLTMKEYSLLEFMMKHKNQTISRMTIINKVWKYSLDPASNIIEVYIKRLRSKIDDGYEQNIIENVRGEGYRLRDYSIELV